MTEAFKDKGAGGGNEWLDPEYAGVMTDAEHMCSTALHHTVS